MTERKIEALTHKLNRECKGENIAVVIGACLNMIMTASKSAPRGIIGGIAHSFRDMADRLDRLNRGEQQ